MSDTDTTSGPSDRLRLVFERIVIRMFFEHSLDFCKEADENPKRKTDLVQLAEMFEREAVAREEALNQRDNAGSMAEKT